MMNRDDVKQQTFDAIRLESRIERDGAQIQKTPVIARFHIVAISIEVSELLAP